MCRFFESIKIESGIPQNLNYHQARLNNTIDSKLKKQLDFNLKELISVPNEYCNGIVKCKFEYDSTGYKTIFENYQLKTIKTLKIVNSNIIEYPYKNTDRSMIESLLHKKLNCDDILIIRKGFVTDISFANIIFFDGKQWFTSDTPLLQGTCRRRLLDLGIIHLKNIRISDLNKFTHFSIINAMRGEKMTEIIPISQIYA